MKLQKKIYEHIILILVFFFRKNIIIIIHQLIISYKYFLFLYILGREPAKMGESEAASKYKKQDFDPEVFKDRTGWIFFFELIFEKYHFNLKIISSLKKIIEF